MIRAGLQVGDAEIIVLQDLTDLDIDPGQTGFRAVVYVIPIDRGPNCATACCSSAQAMPGHASFTCRYRAGD